MDHAAPTWRLRGVFAAVVDVVVALAGVAVVTTLLVAALDARANRVAAHLYAREFKVPDEAGCPAAAGSGFWFSCASEVRRIHPAVAIATDGNGAQAQAVPPRGPKP